MGLILLRHARSFLIAEVPVPLGSVTHGRFDRPGSLRAGGRYSIAPIRPPSPLGGFRPDCRFWTDGTRTTHRPSPRKPPLPSVF
ncbi:hypothetical protein KPATCC21470_0486 [Kitasatospora purpeofusca]